MPVLIQRVPQGLLSLFDSKAGGVAPSTFSEEVRCTVDMRDFLAMGERRAFGVTTAGVVAPTILVPAGFTVPNGELWRVLALTVRILRNTSNPGGNCGVNIPPTSGGGVQYYALSDTINAESVAGAINCSGWEGEMWWLPGYQGAFNATNNAAGTSGDYTLSILLERFLT